MIPKRTPRLQLSTGVCTALLVLMSFGAPGSKEPKHLERLTQELADEAYAIREKATEQLWKLGDAALPRLRELTDSKDPEQAIRARELVRKIELGVFPDSDPELLSIINRYPDAMISEKKSLMSDLRERKAWRQMLKLYQEETNETIRKDYLSMMNRIAVYAAREKLIIGDSTQAYELLRLAPRTPDGLLALAEFHRHQGTLAEELEKAKNLEGADAALWRMALHRSAGNIEEALKQADPDKHPELAAAMAAFNGDPVPWLQLRSQESKEEDLRSRRMSQESRRTYARLAIDRWDGAEMNSEDLDKLIDMTENRSSQYRRIARSSLYLLGEHKTADKTLYKDAPMMAVNQLMTLERIDEALKLLGSDINNLCTQQWVRDKIAEVDEDGFDDVTGSNGSQTLFIMAGFLESRGLHELAFECFHEPLLDLAKQDRNSFLDFMSSLMVSQSGALEAPRLAIRVASSWAKDDDDRWALLTDAFWAGDDDSYEWWRLMGKIEPKATRAERLEQVLVLMRRLPGEDGQRRQWVERVWEHYQLSDEDVKTEMLGRMVNLAFVYGDVELADKIWPVLPEELQNDDLWRIHISFLSAQDDWDGVCDVLLKQVELMRQREDGSINPAFQAYAAAALRRAGRAKEAEKYDQLVDMLYLGDSIMAHNIAKAYAFGDDYERNRLWARRAALSANPNSGRGFTKIITDYAETLLFESSEWPMVAALYEVACCEGIDSNYYEPELPILSIRSRLKSDTYRALSRLEKDKRKSLQLLGRCHQQFITDGVLADFFFPALREAGLIESHDRWFAATWQEFEKVLQRFPESANTQNTAAWFASRAQRELDQAEVYLTKALKKYPEQPAYLDTMAEIQFAKGKRKDALKWSRQAILMSPNETQLRQQYHHFRHDPLPK